jgi:hypothetical protein
MLHVQKEPFEFKILTEALDIVRMGSDTSNHTTTDIDIIDNLPVDHKSPVPKSFKIVIKDNESTDDETFSLSELFSNQSFNSVDDIGSSLCGDQQQVTNTSDIILGAVTTISVIDKHIIFQNEIKNENLHFLQLSALSAFEIPSSSRKNNKRHTKENRPPAENKNVDATQQHSSDILHFKRLRKL